jgi:hypothetical protein
MTKQSASDTTMERLATANDRLTEANQRIAAADAKIVDATQKLDTARLVYRGTAVGYGRPGRDTSRRMR